MMMRDPGHGEWLRELEVFSSCNRDCTARLLSQLRLERYGDGDVISCGRGAEGDTVRIIKEGCVEVTQRLSGSQHTTKEVLADGEYFGSLPALGVAQRMGATSVRAMGQVECFALSDESVRNVLAGGARPATSSRAATAERSARAGTADFHSGWGRSSKAQVFPAANGLLPAPGSKQMRRLASRGQNHIDDRLPSRSGQRSRGGDASRSCPRGGVAPQPNEEQSSLKNFLAGDWVSVQVHKVHADAWVDAGRSADDSMAMVPIASVTPTRGSTSPPTTPCKPATPCSRRSFRRQVYSSRPCSRKKEDSMGPSVPGTPGKRMWPGRSWLCSQSSSRPD